MNHIRRILAAVAILAGALLALAPASAAYAALPHYGPYRPPGPPTTVHVIAAGGMPGWQITLIAAGAALAAAAAILLDRTRMARKAPASPA